MEAKITKLMKGIIDKKLIYDINIDIDEIRNSNKPPDIQYKLFQELLNELKEIKSIAKDYLNDPDTDDATSSKIFKFMEYNDNRIETVKKIMGENFCSKVIRIPQYVGSCWFNAILMAILYSEYSRHLLLKNNIYANSSKKVYKIINDIIVDKYISTPDAINYFKVMRPEVILSYILRDKFLTNDLVTTGASAHMFLPKFIKYIGKTALTLDHYNKIFYIGISENIDYIHDKNKVQMSFKISNIENTFIETLVSKKNPDYIIINDWANLANSKDVEFVSNFIDPVIKHYNDRYTLNKLKKVSRGIKTFDSYVYFNGDDYYLDSCILCNYNKDTAGGHAITGLTCEKEKYVYNGWIRSSRDPNIPNAERLIKSNEPCELMKYNWDVHNDDEFVINPISCKLDRDIPRNQTFNAFSFAKGKRTLIYVKKDYSKSKQQPAPKPEQPEQPAPKPEQPEEPAPKQEEPHMCKKCKKSSKPCKKCEEPPKPDEQPKKEKPKKECPPGKIQNPDSGRCINANGATAKTLYKNKVVKKECPEDSILNPVTNRCVKKNGAIGRKLSKGL